MKRLALLIVLASLTVAFVGCSKHSPAASLQENNRLGVIDVPSNNPSSYTLADGRICTIMPTLLKSGNVKLNITIAEANGSKKTLVFETPADGYPETIRIDKSTAITVASRNTQLMSPK